LYVCITQNSSNPKNMCFYAAVAAVYK